MQFIQHYSSSMANLYEAIAFNGERFIIDPGVPWRKVMDALHYDLTNIVACLISHEHHDHSHAVREIMRAGIDVYASKGTLEALGLSSSPKAHGVTELTLITYGGIQALPFGTNHDAAEPMGFVIRDQEANEYLLFATDTSFLTQRFNFPFSIIAIEAAYDKEILQKRVEAEDVNETYAKRLLAAHLEWHNTLNYLTKYCNLSRCHQIHLLHMSEGNLDKKRVRNEIEKATYIETFTIADTQIRKKGLYYENKGMV